MPVEIEMRSRTLKSCVGNCVPALLGAVLVGALGCASSNLTGDCLILNVNYCSSAVYYGTSVSSPLGHFVIAKQGESLCYIRVMHYSVAGAQSPPTIFSSGDPSVSATIELHAPIAGDAFARDPIQSRTFIAKSGPTVGFTAGLAFGTSANERFRCGTMELRWHYPTFISGDLGGRPTYGSSDHVYLSASAFGSVASIQLSDPRLLWIRSGEKSMPKQTIPIEALAR